jgi:hypothetical protein
MASIKFILNLMLMATGLAYTGATIKLTMFLVDELNHSNQRGLVSLGKLNRALLGTQHTAGTPRGVPRKEP